MKYPSHINGYTTNKKWSIAVERLKIASEDMNMLKAEKKDLHDNSWLDFLGVLVDSSK